MPSEPQLADELAAAFARMSGLVLSHESVRTLLELVTALATEAIPGAVGAGVSLMDERGRRTTTAATDEGVQRADDLQYELDDGPCIAAWREQRVVRVDDTEVDTRWPRWSGAVTGLQVRGALSAPLLVSSGALGAMKVYADEPNVFDERSERLLVNFAAQAAVLLANMQSLEAAQALSAGLRGAMGTRDTIATAKGVLMGRDGVDAETAFAMLVSVATREHSSLLTVAQGVVDRAGRRRR